MTMAMSLFLIPYINPYISRQCSYTVHKDSDGDLDKKISRSKLQGYEGKVIDFAL